MHLGGAMLSAEEAQRRCEDSQSARCHIIADCVLVA